MLTLLLYVVLALVVVAILFGLAVTFMPRTEQLSPPTPDTQPWRLAADRPLLAEDVERVRLPVALRGYRFAETDLLLDRLGTELLARDEEIDELRALLAGHLPASDERLLAAPSSAGAELDPDDVPTREHDLVGVPPGPVHDVPAGEPSGDSVDADDSDDADRSEDDEPDDLFGFEAEHDDPPSRAHVVAGSSGADEFFEHDRQDQDVLAYGSAPVAPVASGPEPERSEPDRSEFEPEHPDSDRIESGVAPVGSEPALSDPEPGSEPALSDPGPGSEPALSDPGPGSEPALSDPGPVSELDAIESEVVGSDAEAERSEPAAGESEMVGSDAESERSEPAAVDLEVVGSDAASERSEPAAGESEPAPVESQAESGGPESPSEIAEPEAGGAEASEEIWSDPDPDPDPGLAGPEPEPVPVQAGPEPHQAGSESTVADAASTDKDAEPARSAPTEVADQVETADAEPVASLAAENPPLDRTGAAEQGAAELGAEPPEREPAEPPVAPAEAPTREPAATDTIDTADPSATDTADPSATDAADPSATDGTEPSATGPTASDKPDTTPPPADPPSGAPQIRRTRTYVDRHGRRVVRRG